jgi:dTDP-4-dehydrorhamnose reductase
MKILILGAKGNLGQAFAELYKNEQLHLWDRDELDITNQAAVNESLSKLHPDLVINCAAYNAVDQAETEEDQAMQLNGHGVGFIAQTCARLGVTLIHYSTHYVFDGEQKDGYTEDAAPNAHSAYARSKILGERLLAEAGCDYYLIRTAWLYSSNTSGKKSFIEIMKSLAASQPEVRVVSDEFGHPTWVRDLAAATQMLLTQNFPFGIYHLVNEGSASWYDWAKEIFRICRLSTSLRPVAASEFPRPVMRPHFGILKNTKGPRLRPWQEALRAFLTGAA